MVLTRVPRSRMMFFFIALASLVTQHKLNRDTYSQRTCPISALGFKLILNALHSKLRLEQRPLSDNGDALV
jgi:hypothetical protein